MKKARDRYSWNKNASAAGSRLRNSREVSFELLDDSEEVRDQVAGLDRASQIAERHSEAVWSEMQERAIATLQKV